MVRVYSTKIHYRRFKVTRINDYAVNILRFNMGILIKTLGVLCKSHSWQTKIKSMPYLISYYKQFLP